MQACARAVFHVLAYFVAVILQRCCHVVLNGLLALCNSGGKEPVAIIRCHSSSEKPDIADRIRCWCPFRSSLLLSHAWTILSHVCSSSWIMARWLLTARSTSVPSAVICRMGTRAFMMHTNTFSTMSLPHLSQPRARMQLEAHFFSLKLRCSSP